MPPLIFDDGEPLGRIATAMNVLINSVNQFADRNDFFAGAICLSTTAAQARIRLRGPDFFVVLNIDGSYPLELGGMGMDVTQMS